VTDQTTVLILFPSGVVSST